MSRDDREVVVVEQGGGALKWLVLGAALGAGLALLFAPRSGKELRRGLGKGIRQLRQLADDTIEQFQGEPAEGEGEQLRSMADSGADIDEEREVPRRSGSHAAREELERRLAAARARRRQSVPDDEEPVA